MQFTESDGELGLVGRAVFDLFVLVFERRRLSGGHRRRIRFILRCDWLNSR